MKLSACMIAKNEERCIARCISSYRTVVDEVVVVDTGSSDDTPSLARQLGAKVYEIPWEDDFSKAKNAALEKADGDWVLFLDADEWFDGDSAQNLLALIKKLDKDPLVEGVEIRINNLVRPGEPPSYTPGVRAFRRSSAIRYTGAIHEHLVHTGEGATRGLNLHKADPDAISILHDGYLGSVGRGKAGRNIGILEKEAAAGEGGAMTLYYLAQANMIKRNYAEVYKNLHAFLEKEAAATPVALTALLRCEFALQMLGPGYAESPEAYATPRSQLAEEAQRRFPKHPTAHLLAGNASYEQQDLPAALAHYQKAARLREGFSGDAYAENMAENQYPAMHLRMARCLRKAGQEKEAVAHCEKTLQLQPGLPAAFMEYVKCTLNEEPQTAAAKLLKWCDGDEALAACLAAVHAARCDLAFLLVYDRYSATHPQHGHYFTTMQVLVGEHQIAASEVVQRITQHPAWCGSYTATLALLPRPEQEDISGALAEAVAGALGNQDMEAAGWLLAAAPPALQVALRLCLGQEVSGLAAEGSELLPQVGARLAALGAPAEIGAMWQEVLDLFAA